MLDGDRILIVTIGVSALMRGVMGDLTDPKCKHGQFRSADTDSEQENIQRGSYHEQNENERQRHWKSDIFRLDLITCYVW